MRLLLDTHAFIWLMDGDSKLSTNAQEAIDAEEWVYFSLVSFWEMAIKINLGKFQLKRPMVEYYNALDDSGIRLLTPDFLDVATVKDMSRHPHADPFDRMLIAQCWTHMLTMVTKDRVIPLYGVPVLW